MKNSVIRLSLLITVLAFAAATVDAQTTPPRKKKKRTTTAAKKPIQTRTRQILP